MPLDAGVARAYGRVYATARVVGRDAPGRRALDLLIAATALARDFPLYIRSPDDFAVLGDLLEVVTI